MQAQTQKRTRILEQRDLKQFENIDEFEKVTDSANMNDTNEEVLENNAQNRNVQSKACGISTESRKKLDNTCLKSVNVGSLEEAQTHLKPTIVDTSLVKGDIIRVSWKILFNKITILSYFIVLFFYFDIFSIFKFYNTSINNNVTDISWLPP